MNQRAVLGINFRKENPKIIATLAPMALGAFSVSRAVKNIEASTQFYEKLGVAVFAGNQSKNWLIMKHGVHAIGLF